MTYQEIAEELAEAPDTLLFVLLKKHGLSLIGSGGFRRAYSDNKLVYKIGSRGANHSEWDAYAAASDEVKKILAEPYYLSKNMTVIVMKYLPENPTCEEISDFQDEYEGIARGYIWDCWNGNVRKDEDGTIKMIDYQSQDSTDSESGYDCEEGSDEYEDEEYEYEDPEDEEPADNGL